MMLELRTPWDEQVRIRTFFFKAEELRRINRYRALLTELPPELKASVGSKLVEQLREGLARPPLKWHMPLMATIEGLAKYDHCNPDEV